MPDAKPKIQEITNAGSFADRRRINVTVQYPGESPMTVSFTGPTSEYGPVLIAIPGFAPTYVDSPERFGSFGRDWVRKYYSEN